MEKLIREPLIHFLLIGALLFVAFDYINDEPEQGQLKIINVTRADIENIINNFHNTWQRPPSEQELTQLIEEKIRDDITYQEALSLGLQNEDLYIKRRLRMKLESLYIDLSAGKAPTQSELESYLKRHADDFVIDSQLAFSQIYFSPQHTQEELDTQIQSLKKQLNQHHSQANIEQLGDSTLLANHYPLMSIRTIHNQFGKVFADSIDTLEQGKWAGPIRSQYGYHLVKVEHRIPSYIPELREVKVTVERGVLSERRQQFLDIHYQRLRQQYTVKIDNSGSQKATP